VKPSELKDKSIDELVELEKVIVCELW